MAWTPDLIDNLSWWADASQITGLSDGDPIATWPDAAGNGNVIDNTTPSTRPSWQSGVVNGLPVVRFDPATERLNPNLAIANNSPHSIFAIVKVDSALTGNKVLLCGLFGRPFIALRHNVTGGLWGTYMGQAVTAAESLTTGTWHLLAITARNFNDVDLARNGGTATTKTNGTSWGAGAAADFNRQAASQSSVCDVAEIVLYDRALTADERQTVEGYLAWKWGQQASLPADHPYKSGPPTAGMSPALAYRIAAMGDVRLSIQPGTTVTWPLIRRIAAMGDLRFSPSGATY